MTSYDSTARVPFAKGGSVKDKVKKGLKIASYAFPQTWGIAAGEQAKKVAKKLDVLSQINIGKAYMYVTDIDELNIGSDQFTLVTHGNSSMINIGDIIDLII